MWRNMVMVTVLAKIWAISPIQPFWPNIVIVAKYD
jgi:hypothetical protein